MKKSIIILILFLTTHLSQSQQCYVGTTMGFANYLQNTCGIIYKEDGLPKNPYLSIKDHGGNIIRLRLDLPPYSNSYIENEPPVDFRTTARVMESMQTATNAGLKTLLTFSYQSFALEEYQALNPYVAPLNWQSIANDKEKLIDSIHNYTYQTLAEMISQGLIPEIVSIGNETNWRILEPNLPELNLPAYSPLRTVALLNAGTSAVREINTAFGLDIKIALHIFGASNLNWWMNTHVPLGLDFDIMGLSHYHAWHSLGSFNSWTEVVEWVQSDYQKDFMVLETAQLFSAGYSDNHVNVLGIENIPANYPNPPTTATQKNYLKDLTIEILNAGGLGTIAWGGEWVGSNCYIYPDQYGPGSSWENKAFWDFNNNLHDGIDWMKESCPENFITTHEKESVYRIYPVPVVSNFVNIESQNIKIKRVEFYSILGVRLFSFEIKSMYRNKAELDFSNQHIPSGHYIMKITDDSERSWLNKIPVIQKLP